MDSLSVLFKLDNQPAAVEDNIGAVRCQLHIKLGQDAVILAVAEQPLLVFQYKFISGQSGGIKRIFLAQALVHK